MIHEHIQIGGKSYRKFIAYPQPVNDGTCRCIFCGQIDEPSWHDDALCPAIPSERQHNGR